MILEFKVPNLVPHSDVDTLTVSTFPTLGGLRKIAKHVTFQDPLLDIAQPHCTSPSQGLSSLRKTATPKVHFSNQEKTYINGTWHKNPSTSTGKLSPTIKPSPHKPIITPKSAIKEKSPKVTSHCHPSAVQDIFALKRAFPGSLVQYSLARACNQTPPKSKPSKTYPLLIPRLSFSPS